ncbi:MAG: hypothetical protein DIU84_01910 [Bacillota bacterium]|nr:hypothetical protein [Bacillota bacterium]REJ38070.1 MAG: hypothetical protein DIU84_01910 [Bacillota bacterium]
MVAVLDLGETLKSVVELARRQVVHVRALEADGETVTFGSGVILDHTHVLTNAQVVSGGEKKVTVRTANGRKYDAQLVGVDPLYFVTVLELDGWVPYEPMPLMGIDEAATGLPVVAVGNAAGVEYNASFGIISGVDRTIYRPERLPVDGLLITDARVHPGNAAGALVSLDGRLVGINGIPWQNGLSLCVHADVAWRLANQIIDYGQATHAWLGFSGEPEVIDQAVVDLFSLSFDRGVSVMHVAPGGPGEAAGVQVGDLVVRVADRPVPSLGATRRVLSQYRVGDTVPLLVLRDDELVELKMPVREMPRLQRLGGEGASS